MASSAANAAAETTDGSLADATARLESALGRLEALVEAGPFQSELFRPSTASGAAPDLSSDPGAEDGKAELAASRRRETALTAAVATASEALDRAMGQVREVLEAGDAAEAEAAEEPELDLAPATAEASGS